MTSANCSNSAVVETLSLILDAARGTDGTCRSTNALGVAKCHVFSYREDFDVLWSMVRNGLATDAAFDIVIVWDRVPRRQPDAASGGGAEVFAAVAAPVINVADHVTVFDWVAALCCLAARKLQGNEDLPELRVYILDLEPPEQFRQAAEISDPAMLAPLIGPATLDITCLLCDLGVAGSGPAGIPSLKQEQSSLELVAQMLGELMRAQLTKAENRHSIANLVGPAILLDAMDVTKEYDLHNSHLLNVALRPLMATLGLTPDTADREPAPWIPRQRWDDLVDRFVLVDDLAYHGWDRFLTEALGISNDDEFVCCTEPDRGGLGSDGSESIVGLLTNSDGKLRVNHGLSLTGAKREILFLDLRLFSNRDRQTEIESFRSLLALARQAKEGTSSLPWEGFSTAELIRIERCIQDQAIETDDYYTALTTLPRLMALVDPTLPLVLFSSTGQKHIVDALTSYGNIVLDFDKPRFLGHSADTAITETKARLRRAFTNALLLARGRDLCVSIGDAYRAATETLAKYPRPKTQCNHFEVYVEETGTTGRGQFSVGGLVIGYPNAVDADDFHEELKRRNLMWGWHRDDPLQDTPPKSPLAKDSAGITAQQRHTVLGALQAAARDCNLYVAIMSLGTSRMRPSAVSWSGPDGMYRFLLRLLSELVIFEWVPRINQHVSKDGITLSIFAATRILSADALAPGESLVRISRDFGLGLIEVPGRGQGGVYFIEPGQLDTALPAVTSPDVAFVKRREGVGAFVSQSGAPPPNTRRANKLLAFSFGFDDVYPVVEEALQNRCSVAKMVRITAARGVGLRYYDKIHNLTPDQLPRQVHYAADWVLRNATQAPQAWTQRGFVEGDVDDSIVSLVASCRLAQGEERIDATVEWSKSRMKASEPISSWAAQRVGDAVSEMMGVEFVELCRRVDVETAL